MIFFKPTKQQIINAFKADKLDKEHAAIVAQCLMQKKQQMLDEIRDKLIELLINYINGIKQFNFFGKCGFDFGYKCKWTDAYLNIGMQQYVLIELQEAKNTKVRCGLEEPYMPAETGWMEHARCNKETYKTLYNDCKIAINKECADFYSNFYWKMYQNPAFNGDKIITYFVRYKTIQLDKQMEKMNNSPCYGEYADVFQEYMQKVHNVEIGCDYFYFYYLYPIKKDSPVFTLISCNDEWEYDMIEKNMEKIDNILTDLAKIL